MSYERNERTERSWGERFRDALRGLKQGVRGQSSFFVHFFLATVVIVAGLALGVSRIEWCLLAVCIAGVLAAELFNSALEAMAKAITHEHNPLVGAALDIGSAAVLIAAIGAAAVGATVFVHRLGLLFEWWPAP